MRISDTERQRAVDELRRHFAAGRLDIDEFSLRTEKALEASTLEDLDKLLSDLPMLRIADPVTTGGIRASSRLGGGDVSRIRSLPVRPGTRRPAFAVAVTVGVVAGAILLALVSSWVGAAALLIGWLLGMLQSRFRG
jgi:hypothetical protein